MKISEWCWGILSFTLGPWDYCVHVLFCFTVSFMLSSIICPYAISLFIWLIVNSFFCLFSVGPTFVSWNLFTYCFCCSLLSSCRSILILWEVFALNLTTCLLRVLFLLWRLGLDHLGSLSILPFQEGWDGGILVSVSFRYLLKLNHNICWNYCVST